MADHDAVPRAGTQVDRASYARPLAGIDAVCDTCERPITINPVLGRWVHRPS